MRTILIFSFLANVLLTIVVWFMCPGRVAIHFGAGGAPNGWGSANVNALIMMGTHCLLFVSMFLPIRLMGKMPARWINLPNKDYWLRDDNIEKARGMLAQKLYLMGAATFVFMFILGLLAMDANLSVPVRFREEIFWWPFGLFMAFVIYWSIQVILSFRIPKE